MCRLQQGTGWCSGGSRGGAVRRVQRWSRVCGEALPTQRLPRHDWSVWQPHQWSSAVSPCAFLSYSLASCLHTHTRAGTHTHTCTCSCNMHTSAPTHTHMHLWTTHTHTQSQKFGQLPSHTHMQAHTYANACMCRHTHAPTLPHTCTYTRIPRTYTNTHTHRRTHMYAVKNCFLAGFCTKMFTFCNTCLQQNVMVTRGFHHILFFLQHHSGEGWGCKTGFVFLQCL